MTEVLQRRSAGKKNETCNRTYTTIAHNVSSFWRMYGLYILFIWIGMQIIVMYIKYQVYMCIYCNLVRISISGNFKSILKGGVNY